MQHAIMRRWFFSLFSASACCLVAVHARAEGSLGVGGSIGTRMDWPCPGCRFLTPEDVDFDSPIPLMVTFHGDEGDPQYIHSSFSGPAQDANFLLLSLKCPAELGCQDPSYENPGSWYEWRRTDMHDPEWVGRQVDAVEAQYNVELNQVYLAGFSGGSIYTSWYALEFADRFAGVNYLGGGSAPRNGCTATCEIPAYFLIGSKDFLIDGARGMHDYLEGCMHDVLWDEVPGVDHTIIRENLPEVLQWLVARPHMCRDDGGDESGSSDGDETGDSGSDSDEGDGGTGGEDSTSGDGMDDSDPDSGSEGEGTDGEGTEGESGSAGSTEGGSAGEDGGTNGTGGDSGVGGDGADAGGGPSTTAGVGQDPWQHDDASCRVVRRSPSPPLAAWLWVVVGLGFRRRRVKT